MRIKGHRLHTESVRGGIIAECSCEHQYSDPSTRTGIFPAWSRDKIRKAHQEHLAGAVRKFFIDWSDPPYPEIRPIEMAWRPDREDAKSFAQCRQEIVAHFQAEIDFARGQIAYYRAQRMADALKEGE